MTVTSNTNRKSFKALKSFYVLQKVSEKLCYFSNYKCCYRTKFFKYILYRAIRCFFFKVTVVEIFVMNFRPSVGLQNITCVMISYYFFMECSYVMCMWWSFRQPNDDMQFIFFPHKNQKICLGKAYILRITKRILAWSQNVWLGRYRYLFNVSNPKITTWYRTFWFLVQIILREVQIKDELIPTNKVVNTLRVKYFNNKITFGDEEVTKKKCDIIHV